MSNTVKASGGVSFSGLLTIAFVVLKLLGYIDWSWWWVLSPLWISAGIGILLVILFFAFIMIFDR